MSIDTHDLFKVRTSKIIDGHAWTEDDTRLFTDLSQEDQAKVIDWIKAGLVPRSTPAKQYTSYTLKHLLEADIRIYMTNNQFKDAMLVCGYEPVNPAQLNWTYRISLRSPAIKRHAGNYPEAIKVPHN